MQKRIEKVIAALQKNNMQGIYVPCICDIRRTVEQILFKGATITSGGSVSLVESGVWDLINCGGYNFLDRSRAGITPEEKEAVFKANIGADFFLCSTNAITENGELINVDGFSNRIAAIAFGPKKVIMVVGANKIVKDVNEGFLRVKTTAAPKNCVRLGLNNPCAKLGHCVSMEKNHNPEIIAGCGLDSRICVNYMVTAKQREKDRIIVILCGEDLGY